MDNSDGIGRGNPQTKVGVEHKTHLVPRMHGQDVWRVRFQRLVDGLGMSLSGDTRTSVLVNVCTSSNSGGPVEGGFGIHLKFES